MEGFRAQVSRRDGRAGESSHDRVARRTFATRELLGRVLLRGRIALSPFDPARVARRRGRETRVSLRFVVLFGAPAVGKRAAGRGMEGTRGLRLFHNHLSIEPVLPFFEFGSPPFVRLVDGFRTRLIEEVAASDHPGVVFTFVWDFGNPSDAEFLERMSR